MFKLIRIDNGRQNVPETAAYEATASEAISVGEALVLSSGKLTKCSATAKPTFIAFSAVSATATDRTVYVYRVRPEQHFEVATSADASAVKVGALVTLGSDGLTVTATTTSGVAEIVRNESTASGDLVEVRF